MENIKNSLLSYVKHNQKKKIDLSDIFYSFKKSYRYIVAILLLKSVLSAENTCKDNKLIMLYWNYLYKLVILFIFIVSLYDYQTGILLGIIIMIQKCFR